MMDFIFELQIRYGVDWNSNIQIKAHIDSYIIHHKEIPGTCSMKMEHF